MEEYLYYVWLVIALLGILIAAELFTNAKEWAGYNDKLGEGGVGSVLAGIGTDLPETLIPMIALIGGIMSGDEAIMLDGSQMFK